MSGDRAKIRNEDVQKARSEARMDARRTRKTKALKRKNANRKR